MFEFQARPDRFPWKRKVQNRTDLKRNMVTTHRIDPPFFPQKKEKHWFIYELPYGYFHQFLTAIHVSPTKKDWLENPPNLGFDVNRTS